MKRVSNTSLAPVLASVIAVITFALGASELPSAYAQAPAYSPAHAYAQAPAYAPAPASPEPVAPGSETPRDDDSGPYSPGTALTLSIMGTGMGYGLLTLAANRDSEGLAWAGVLGTLIGPSVGHIYAGDTRGAVVQTSLRGLGGAMMLAGLVIALGETSDSGSVHPLVLLYGGFALYTGTTIYSIIDAPRSARRANRRQRELLITPSPIVGPDRSMGVGMTLGASF